MNYLKKFILLIYFRIEYIVTAYISFIILKLKGTNYLKRTRNRNDIKELKQKIEKRLAKLSLQMDYILQVQSIIISLIQKIRFF